MTFLVSLYLPWFVSRIGFGPHLRHAWSVADPGWGSYESLPPPFSQPAGVSALALAALALADLFKPGRKQLPLEVAALVFGVFVVGSTSQQWDSEIITNPYNGGLYDIARFGPGAYLGLAAAGIACVAVVALRWRELVRRRSVVTAVGQALWLVLLVAFVSPAVNEDFGFAGGGIPTAICLTACVALATWPRKGQPGLRLAMAGAVAVLVIGGYPPNSYLSSYYSAWPYELWIVVACTLALLVLSVADVRSLRIRKPSIFEAATALGALVLLGSLFLPWRYSTRGWLVGDSGIAGVFVLLLLVGFVARRRYYVEATFGAALYVMSAGYADQWENLGYGAFVGFVGAGLLLFAGLSTFRPIPPRRLLTRSVPIVACLAFLSFVVAGNSEIYADSTFVLQSPWYQALWFPALVAVLISLRLLVTWTSGPPGSTEAVLLPLGLVALTVLALVYIAAGGSDPADTGAPPGISWEGWVSLSLGVLLVACGWVEGSGRSFAQLPLRPAGWRVDRISAAKN